MSSNYWESTQRKYWLYTKEQLASKRRKHDEDHADIIRSYPLPELRHLYIFFGQQISRLGKRLAIRQQAMATAQIYLKRFYSTVEIRRTNPYLVIAASVYLACKMEECPQHIRMIVSEAKSLWQEYIALDTSKLGECEFYLISEMSSQLIIHQPYRTLMALQPELGIATDDASLAWSIINDHYMTDLPLLYPPHTIALTAIMLSIVLRPNTSGLPNQPTSANAAAGITAAAFTLTQAQNRQSGGPGTPPVATPTASGVASQAGPPGTMVTPAQSPGDREKQDFRMGRLQRFATWLAESNVDIEAMVDCAQEIISFYDVHEQYNDKITREQINRFIKARSLDR